MDADSQQNQATRLSLCGRDPNRCFCAEWCREPSHAEERFVQVGGQLNVAGRGVRFQRGIDVVTGRDPGLPAGAAGPERSHY